MKCPKCGAEIENVKFCPECGAPVASGPVTAAIESDEKPEKKKKGHGCGCAVAVSVALIVFVMMITPSSSTTSSTSGTKSSTSIKSSISADDGLTMGQRNALRSAENYLSAGMGFSYSGLEDQLEYEGYSTEDATYAVDHCGADWDEQAAIRAKNYINSMSFSRSGLIEQLEFEGFSQSQAEYGATVKRARCVTISNLYVISNRIPCIICKIKRTAHRATTQRQITPQPNPALQHILGNIFNLRAIIRIACNVRQIGSCKTRRCIADFNCLASSVILYGKRSDCIATRFRRTSVIVCMSNSSI